MFDETQPVPSVPAPQPDDTQANAPAAPDAQPAAEAPAPEAPAPESAPSASVEAATPSEPQPDTSARPETPPSGAEASADPESETTLSVNGVSVTSADVAALLEEVQSLRTWHDLKEDELVALRAELAEHRAAS